MSVLHVYFNKFDAAMAARWAYRIFVKNEQNVPSFAHEFMPSKGRPKS